MNAIKNLTNQQLWMLVILTIVFMICLTLLFLQSQAWIVRFEMDNNTLEAIKSINWSAIPK